MSLCCIGGVCVPYSAILPLFFLGLRWILQKVVALGLLPQSVHDRFFPSNPQSSKYAPVKEGCSQRSNGGSCCAVTANSSCATTTATATTDGSVVTVESEEQFRDILKQPYVICKFTASWCRPCKEIHPIFVSLAQKHTSAVFCTIDVDDLEEISQEYNVAMMPTFLVFRNGQVQDTMTGISLLEDFVQKALQ